MPDVPSSHPAQPPHTRSLRRLEEAARECTACHLYERATQTVFGAGPRDADVVVVGEQPGDQEDRQGKPFVGPAGRILDQALQQAGIDPERVYVTNAVKHFKWRPVGKRRLHDRPDRDEIETCKPWLIAELQSIQPRAVVALGATAAVSLVGKRVTISRMRGQVHQVGGCALVVTYHPSSVLRAKEDRDQRMGELVEDLQRVADLLAA